MVDFGEGHRGPTPPLLWNICKRFIRKKLKWTFKNHFREFWGPSFKNFIASSQLGPLFQKFLDQSLSLVLLWHLCRDANSRAFCRRLTHFWLISCSPAFYRNLPHYSIIIDNIGDIRRYEARQCELFNSQHNKSFSPKKISHILNFRGWHPCLWATIQGYTTLSNGTSLLAIAGQWVLYLVYFEWTPILKHTCCKHMLLIAGVNLQSQPEQIETIQKHNK